jgi:small subunit ribosomal protein S6
MAELEHAFRFNDAVLRHLTVVKKKADTGPSSMMKTVEREEARKAQQAEFAATGERGDRPDRGDRGDRGDRDR